MITAITFAAYLVPATSGIKREVRCDSGAIPVAVSSFRESLIVSHAYRMIHASQLTIGLLDLQTTVPVFGMGRYQNRERARRPATYKLYHSRLSGEKHGI